MTAPIVRKPSSSLTGRRGLRAVGLGLVGALVLTACSGQSDPTEDAEAFGTALANRDLDSSTLTEQSAEPEQVWDSLTELEDLELSVTLDAAEVYEPDAEDANAPPENVPAPTDDAVTATADYTVTWDLTELGVAGHEESEWSYSTQAALFWDDETEAWVPHFAPDTLVPGLAADGEVRVETESPTRGEILDESGEPLMTNRPVQRIGLDKTLIDDDQVADSAQEIADILDLDADNFVAQAEATGDQAFVEAITLRDDGSEDIPDQEISAVDGGRMLDEEMMLAPSRTFARSVLGTYGEPTAEQIENADGELTAGVPAGLSGLHAGYNDELAGQSGLNITVHNIDVASEDLPGSDPVEFSAGAEAGDSITTTLDEDIQQLAEDTLADTDVPAALVVLRPSDGHILAAAEGPDDVTYPMAMSGSYAPGSTYKLVTALAMLRDGYTPDSLVECPQTINAAGTEISNFDGYPAEYTGDISLAEAVAQSCNTAFVGQWENLSADDLAESAAALGLVADPQSGFPGTFLGHTPDDAEGTTHAANLFGQGVVQTSPLGMATVAASIGSGAPVAPVLVSDPEVDPAENEAFPPAEPITSEEAETMRELMAGPVTDGTVPILQDVPGSDVLAKTGTAEYVDDDEDLARTWITALHEDLAVALFYNEGLAGGQTNGPVLQEFLTELDEIAGSS